MVVGVNAFDTVGVQKSGIHFGLRPADLDGATKGDLKCCTTAMPISPSMEMIANTRPYLETSTMTLSPQSAMSPATIAKWSARPSTTEARNADGLMAATPAAIAMILNGIGVRLLAMMIQAPHWPISC